MGFRSVTTPLIIGMALAVAAPLVPSAEAARHDSHSTRHVSERHTSQAEHHASVRRSGRPERHAGSEREAARHRLAPRWNRRVARETRAYKAPVIQCVTFARDDSGVQLSGNADAWWDNAAGVYARGHAPQPGAVLSFRATSRMRLGHVAVVADVINSRTIEIDQSHWDARGISRSVSVIDVSENNDWTAVRVGLGHTGSYGSIYPTNGFIYAQPAGRGAPVTTLASARPAAGRHAVVLNEQVAEVPRHLRGIDLSTDASADGLSLDAPDRALR